MSHTPGPWRKCGGATPKYTSIHSPHGYIVFRMADSFDDKENGQPIAAPNMEEQQANARLIAQSPALLEVCKELLEEHYLFRKDNRLVCPFCMTESIADCPVNFPHSPDCPVIKARQVIAKAEGREA